MTTWLFAERLRCNLVLLFALAILKVRRYDLPLRKKKKPVTVAHCCILHTSLTLMGKASTIKRPNRKPTLAASAFATTKKKHSSLGNASASTSKPHKKTRKDVRSHQQTIQARDTLDAEYRDWRTGVSNHTRSLSPPPFFFFTSWLSPTAVSLMMLCVSFCQCVTNVEVLPFFAALHSQTTSVIDLPLQPPDFSTTTPMPVSVSQTAGLASHSVQISEQSVQDLAGVLSAL